MALVVLGRTALDQGDRESARAAFRQAVDLVRGRPRMSGGGRFLVYALAGLGAAAADRGAFEEASALLESRADFNFIVGPLLNDLECLRALEASARALGREEDARRLGERAAAERLRWLGSEGSPT